MKEIIATLGAEGATASAIKKWRQRGEVPPKHQLLILDLAVERGLPVTKHDFVFPPSLRMPKPRKPAKKTRAV